MPEGNDLQWRMPRSRDAAKWKHKEASPVIRVWVNCILAPTIAGLPGDLQRQAQLKWPLAQVQASSNARQIQFQLFFTNAGQLQLSRN